MNEETYNEFLYNAAVLDEIAVFVTAIFIEGGLDYFDAWNMTFNLMTGQAINEGE